MGGATDHKRYINRETNPGFAARFDSWINQGVIPPFALLFPNTELGHITDEDKPMKDLIQFGFMIRDETGNVLVNTRTAFCPNAKAGHTITLGDSVLVGWSPVELPAGRRYPASEEDVRYIFHREVPELSALSPKCSFIGLVINRLHITLNGTSQVVQYFFYLFEMRYSGMPDFSRIRFRKDKNDLPKFFVPVDRKLVHAVQAKKADLRALEAITGSAFLDVDYGDSLFLPPSPTHLPPYLNHPPGVFLSHATADDATANLLADMIQKAGVSVWCDHHSLWPGQSWRWEISDAIRYGPCFVVLCSEASAKSQGVREEVQLALERKISDKDYLLLPAVLDGEDKFDHVDSSIRDSIWVADLRNRADRPDRINYLVDLVKNHVRHDEFSRSQAGVPL